MKKSQKLFILLSLFLLIIIIPTSFASDLDSTNISIDQTSAQVIDITSNEDKIENIEYIGNIENVDNIENFNNFDNINPTDNNSNNFLKDNLNIKSEKTSQLSDIKENFTEENRDEENKLLKNNNNVLKDSSTVYFDANAAIDGTGTESSPYKTLNGRLSGYSTYIFAPGTYTISSAPYSFLGQSDMTLIGSNPITTIIEYTGSGTFLNTSSILNFIGISLKNIHIESSGLLNATNTIFDGGVAPVEAEGNYYYGNSYGGAIKKSSSGGLFDSIFGSSSKGLILNNCTFKNNHAAYGGAIYISNDSANITNTIFENNYAENGGGSISAINGANLTIINSKFNNDYSKYDGAGGVYLFNYSKAIIKDSQFNNNSAGLGAGVTSLRSTAIISNSNFTGNNVSYAGGAVFGMYGNLSIENSIFDSNYARYGGAIYADNLTRFVLSNGVYSSNQAVGIGGAILSFTNKESKITNPNYRNNKAEKYPDLYESEYLDIFIGNENYDMLVYNSSYAGVLPSKFDLRDINAVTGLNDQANSGNCWAYSSIAVLESCAMKASGNAYNFSEGNLKNLAQIFSDFGWGYETNEGGFYQMPIGYLTSWLGPVNSSEDPADDWDVIAPVLDSQVHIQNILYLGRTSYTDNNKIKEAIMKYGAIATEIYISNSYLQSNGNYYCNKDMDRNHAICVIGWDDSRSISGAPGNGAWIVKNSYGSKWGDGGYGYVSYYDHTLFKLNDNSHNSFTIIFNDTVRLNKNYQYDYAGFTDYFVTGEDTIYYANEFNSTGNDNLVAFSTYFNKTSDWEAKVYLNSILMETINGSSDGGYYTFYLNDPIELKETDIFRIEIKLKSKDQANFPICEASQYGATRKHFKPGISFFSYDGETWTDLYDYNFTYGDGQSAGSHIYSGQVACIKAFTSTRDKNSSESNSTNTTNTTDPINTTNTTNETNQTNTTDPINETNNTDEKIYPNITVSVKDINVGETLIFKITFDCENAMIKLRINNETYISLIQNGECSFSISNLKKGSYDYTIEFDGNNQYNSSTIQGNITVSEVEMEVFNTTIILNPLVKYYGGSKELIIRLIDDKGNPLENKILNIEINCSSDESKNKAYYRLTEKNGTASISINQDIGEYDVFVRFLGDDEYNPSNQSSKISIKDTFEATDLSQRYGTVSPIYVYAHDINGNPLKNLRIRFKVANGWYSRKTNDDGIAKLNIYLAPGDYIILSINELTNESCTSNVKIVNNEIYGLRNSFNELNHDLSKLKDSKSLISLNKFDLNIKTDSLNEKIFKPKNECEKIFKNSKKENLNELKWKKYMKQLKTSIDMNKLLMVENKIFKSNIRQMEMVENKIFKSNIEHMKNNLYSHNKGFLFIKNSMDIFSLFNKNGLKKESFDLNLLDMITSLKLENFIR